MSEEKKQPEIKVAVIIGVDKDGMVHLKLPNKATREIVVNLLADAMKIAATVDNFKEQIVKRPGFKETLNNHFNKGQ